MIKLLLPLFLLCSCSVVQGSTGFEYSEYQTTTFKIAYWSKIQNPQAPYRVYIEGDGAAFTANGYPSLNPTPRSDLVRRMAANDPAQNVIYLARPCQYVKDNMCHNNQYWSTARFSTDVLQAEYETVKAITHNQPLTLIGYSGGAQISGLLAVKYQDLTIHKLITVAGNLDTDAWIKYHHLSPLLLSENLADYRIEYAKLPQKHFIGMKDDNIIPAISINFINDDSKYLLIKNASHNSGWEAVFAQIYKQ